MRGAVLSRINNYFNKCEEWKTLSLFSFKFSRENNGIYFFDSRRFKKKRGLFLKENKKTSPTCNHMIGWIRFFDIFDT